MSKKRSLNIPSPKTSGYTPFGREVKKRLIDLGLSQTQLEKELGIPYCYLTAMIIGKRSGIKYLPRVAEYLGIDLEKYSA